jgi:hypothetical protein
MHFTVKGEVLYVIVMQKKSATDLLISSLASGQGIEGKVTSVTMLGMDQSLPFTQRSTGLKVSQLGGAPDDHPFTLKVTGLKMNPPTSTASGDPMLNSQ